jgi:hypothetical protein
MRCARMQIVGRGARGSLGDTCPRIGVIGDVIEIGRRLTDAKVLAGHGGSRGSSSDGAGHGGA